MSGELGGVYTTLSYQHCPVQYPMLSGVVMSVKTAAPEASSVRKKRALFVPESVWLPTPAYMRVAPFGSVVTANSARSVLRFALIGVTICVQLAPLSVERQIPRENSLTYSTPAWVGS